MFEIVLGMDNMVIVNTRFMLSIKWCEQLCLLVYLWLTIVNGYESVLMVMNS